MVRYLALPSSLPLVELLAQPQGRRAKQLLHLTHRISGVPWEEPEAPESENPGHGAKKGLDDVLRAFLPTSRERDLLLREHKNRRLRPDAMSDIGQCAAIPDHVQIDRCPGK